MTTALSVTDLLPAEFGYTVVVVGLLCFHVILTAYIFVVPVRKAVFKSLKSNKEFEALSDQHKKEFGQPLSPSGYPDMGNGRYADLLPYADWVRFNNAQRAHGNYLEQFPSVVTMVLVNGLFTPLPASALGVTYMLGRHLYALGYTGASFGRLPGGLLSFLSVLSLFALVMYNGASLAGLLPVLGARFPLAA